MHQTSCDSHRKQIQIEVQILENIVAVGLHDTPHILYRQAITTKPEKATTIIHTNCCTALKEPKYRIF